MWRTWHACGHRAHSGRFDQVNELLHRVITLREFGEMAQEDETGPTLPASVTDDDAEDQGRP